MDILQVSKVYREIIKNTSDSNNNTTEQLLDQCVERSSLTIDQIRSLIFDYDMDILFNNDFVTVWKFIDYMDFYMKHDLHEKAIRWIKEKFDGKYDKIHDLPEHLGNEFIDDLKLLDHKNYDKYCNLDKKDMLITVLQFDKFNEFIKNHTQHDELGLELCDKCHMNLICNCATCAYKSEYGSYYFDYDEFDVDDSLCVCECCYKKLCARYNVKK